MHNLLRSMCDLITPATFFILNFKNNKQQLHQQDMTIEKKYPYDCFVVSSIQ